jgi:hypothetical protein
MTNEDNKYAKVLFRYHSNILDEITVETMWAIKIDEKNGIYKLDSIPFYGPLIATDDEFYAEFDESEQALTYRYTIKHSGNSIVLVSITKERIDKENIRNEFKSMGYTSEGVNESYFSMEIPVSSDYSIIKKKLDEYKKQDIFEYAEPCISEKHWNEINN